jgi:hypothetical protein
MTMINMVEAMIKVVKCGKPKEAAQSTVIMVAKAMVESSRSSNGIASNREAETPQAMDSQVVATGTMETA